MRIGLIGYGNWGKRIYETLCTFPNVDVSIIEKNAPASYCDAVIIATPSSTHAELALNYLEKKIPTFVEKPLATSTRDVARIIDCVNANNSLLFVGYIYLYNNFLDIIKDNLYKIGPINSIEFIGYNQKPRIDSSLFWDWLPHDLTIYKKLFDVMPNLVAAKNIMLNDQIHDSEAIFNNNGHMIISRLSSQRRAKRSITFEGQKGQIQFDDGQRFLKIDFDDEKMQFDSLSYIPPLRTELAEFINVIQYKDKDIQFNVGRTLEDSMKIADLIERAENLAKSF